MLKSQKCFGANCKANDEYDTTVWESFLFFGRNCWCMASSPAVSVQESAYFVPPHQFANFVVETLYMAKGRYVTLSINK